MRVLLVLVAIVMLSGCAVQAAPTDSAAGWLRIMAPAPGEDLSGLERVTISWQSILGSDVTYAISYSLDGVSFDRQIAGGLRDCQYEWTPGNRAGLCGWIKVKAYDSSGVLQAEAVAPVRFVPPTAIVVSKANQKVYHFSGGLLKNVFTCSTALPKYDMPAGNYKVYSRQVNHWSREYEVWMPHSLFFFRGYAVHATTMIRQLGRPASHGCIRLHPRDAKTLYEQVEVGTPVIVLPRTQDCSRLTALFRREKQAPKNEVVAKARPSVE